MSDRTAKEALREARWLIEVRNAGYLGMAENGALVDRRKYPDAIPIPKNESLNVPEPKPVKREED